jgi:hypothetical protein
VRRSPYHGHLDAIDVATHKITANWIVTGSYSAPDGGGIWGYGGVSGDPTNGALYAATGNSFGASEHAGYAEHVVRLNSSLSVVASNYPGLAGFDVDFGSTPAIFHRPGCPYEIAVINKSGALFVYNRTSIGAGPLQRVQISRSGAFAGVVAFSPVTNMLYVSNPHDSNDGTYLHGLIALQVQANCSLKLAWQQTVGLDTFAVSSPTVANGVVYYGLGYHRQVFAFDAATGDVLWNSGSMIGGAVFGAPSVANGVLYVGSWDRKLRAFGPAA